MPSKVGPHLIWWRGTSVPVLVACLLFAQSLSGDFTFDDRAAVKENRDVVQPGAPWRQLLGDDFWGGRVDLELSNKSYRRAASYAAFKIVQQNGATQPPHNSRPVTVALFRLLRELVKPEGGVPPAWPYRLANLVLHAGERARRASVPRTAVLTLCACCLCSRHSAGACSGPSPGPAGGPSQGGVVRGGRWYARLLLPCCLPSTLSVRPTRFQRPLALLFASHPVHVEVVCGAVGAAELLGGLCALGGVRFYADAVAGHQASAGKSVAALCAACGLALMGAFSKETALSVLAAYVALEWLWWCANEVGGAIDVPPKMAAPAGVSEALPAPPPRNVWALRALARCAAVVGTGVAYVSIRAHMLGNTSLVKTYRVVDNHIPFLPTRQARLLTALHSHWYYVYLLFWPVRLCADWNYSCIPPVTSWQDARNAGTLVLYIYLVVAALRAKPWRIPPLTRTTRTTADGALLMRRRVHAAIIAALSLAPLFPASNLVVHIGAYLAERLLYLPSVGFCLMYASVLTRTVVSSPSKSRRVAATAVISLTCVLYTLRTLARVPDWRNEKVLFMRGAETCPDGAKARVNAGVQARLAGNCTLARTHFKESLRVLPNDQYCEPMYGLALCAMDEDNAEEAVDYFTRSLSCIETATMAAQALRSVLAGMWSKYPDQPAILLRYAQVATRIGGDARQACAAVGLAVNFLRDRPGGLSTRDLDYAYALCPGGADVALAAAKDGPPPQLTRIHTCEDACRTVRADGKAIMGDARAELPPELLAHAGNLSPADRTALAQRVRFAALTHTFLKRHSAACRGLSAYTEAVNALQTMEPYNADLHAEWARMLREMPSRDAEALQHMQFAANMWTLEAQQMPPGSKAAKRAMAHAERARQEIISWEGVPAGPKSVSSLSSPQLKMEL